MSRFISKHSRDRSSQFTNLVSIHHLKIQFCVICWKQLSFKELFCSFPNCILNNIFTELDSDNAMLTSESSNKGYRHRNIMALPHLVSYVFKDQFTTIFSCIFGNSWHLSNFKVVYFDFWHYSTGAFNVAGNNRVLFIDNSTS